MEVDRPNYQEEKRIPRLVDYSLDNASWTPTENFTYPEELQKMIDRDHPVEDN